VPLGTLDYVPYAWKSPGLNASSWDELAKSQLRVGIKVGDKLTEQKLGSSIATKATSFEALFQMLALDRIDIVIAPQGELQRIIPKLSLEMRDKLRGVMALAPLSSVPLYHYLHRRNQALMDPLNQVLQQMTADGTIEKTWTHH
jgi:polar amino acid transport system substrate-binding protein